MLVQETAKVRGVRVFVRAANKGPVRVAKLFEELCNAAPLEAAILKLVVCKSNGVLWNFRAPIDEDRRRATRLSRGGERVGELPLGAGEIRGAVVLLVFVNGERSAHPRPKDQDDYVALRWLLQAKIDCRLGRQMRRGRRWSIRVVPAHKIKSDFVAQERRDRQFLLYERSRDVPFACHIARGGKENS